MKLRLSDLAGFTILLSVLTCALSCGPKGGAGATAQSGRRQSLPGGTRLQGVNFTDPVLPIAHDDPVSIAAAKNEETGFALQISNLPAPTNKKLYTLRLHRLNLDDGPGAIEPAQFVAYQILPMPVDMNRAAYVRHTGREVSRTMLPRALLPVNIDNGAINLAALRDPDKATDPNSRGAGTGHPMLVWVDLRVPPEAKAGTYSARCDIIETGNAKPLSSVDVHLTVHDFLLPDERHLQMVSRLDWESLTRLYNSEFEAVTPRLLSRKDKTNEKAVHRLDQLVSLAQQHRTQVIIPRLQPTVKWPPGAPPQVTWDDYDSIVSPWLRGDVFRDKIPPGYWPMPMPDYFSSFDVNDRLQYWKQAANHFDQLDWLSRSAVTIEKQTPGRASAEDGIRLSAEAARVLALHPNIRVTLPLEDDQLQLAGNNNPALISPKTTGRLLTASPSLVFATPMQALPEGVATPTHWLRTDLPGLIPYIGAGGDERDVRLWAWLAFLKDAQLIQWGSALPRNNSPDEPADPSDLIWFYPGSWFGVDDPLPTVQLKWLRRAQQDYEYFYLAKQRGQVLNALVMARLMTKAVEIQPGQNPDPTYALMCSTADPQAWVTAQDLIARNILLRDPGQASNKQESIKLDLDTLHWMQPQEKQLLMGRSVIWTKPDQQATGENWIDVKLGVDIYNAADMTGDENLLAWSGDAPTGWERRPQPIKIPALGFFHVKRFPMEARIDASQVQNTDRRPLELTFTEGYKKVSHAIHVVLPVANTDRRTAAIVFNGSLEDWKAEDAILNGPMVQMFNRPAIQKQEMQLATTQSQIFSGWSDESLYFAFKLDGLSQADVRAAKNFVTYQSGRAWGEDLCELLIQPMYKDGTYGPTMHVVCKPNGSNWVERKLDPRLYADPWQPFEATAIRFATTLQDATWRGEIAIPWKALGETIKGRPTMLRFNFVQHRTATGESDSWAGPVDYGRDENFMGLLLVRDPENPGMAIGPRDTPR
jgi:hypothetical protein